MSSPTSQESSEFSEQPKKLAVLGLPWETSEETLRQYFNQFGVVEKAEIMKDRYTGKSRGFGFVSYQDAVAAQRALQAEHMIDGRHCEAKVALPKGEASPARTTRIFVARINSSVTEQEFRQYFEQFGPLQDAYMPRDHSKQGFRGIGFVTYTHPESVEKVMACKHFLNGHEVAIDRATPKEDFTNKGYFNRASVGSRRSFDQHAMALEIRDQHSQRRSFDNGSGIVGPGLTSVMNLAQGMGPITGSTVDTFASVRSLSEDRALSQMMARGLDLRSSPLGPSALGMAPISEGEVTNTAGLALSLGQGPPVFKAQTLGLTNPSASVNMGMLNGISTLASSTPITSLTQEALQANLLAPAVRPSMDSDPFLRDVMTMAGTAAAAATANIFNCLAPQSRRSLDQNSLRGVDNATIANARAGPRIFIGKLTKDTSESDVKEYFMKFGYVMDVYLPKAKDNKLEHRGFGFVTFETEAAIQRVVAAGTHRLKGSTIAIDLAMPKEEGAFEGQPQAIDPAAAAAAAAAAASQFHLAAALYPTGTVKI